MSGKQRQLSILTTLLALALLLGAAMPVFAGDTKEVLAANGDFLERVRVEWVYGHQARQESPAGSLRKGETGFVAIAELILGQDEISVRNAIEKLKQQLQESADWSSEERTITLEKNGGRSSIWKKEPLLVVRGPNRHGRPSYLITDGHHELFAALYLGSRTVPVHVELDYSKLSELEFWKKLKEEKLVFLKRSAQSLAQKHPRIEEIRDYPNRYLASLLALKVTQNEDGELDIKKGSTKTSSVWVKLENADGKNTIEGSRAFIEFYLGRILEKAGITYREEWGREVPAKVVAQVRAVLQALDANTDNVLTREELHLIESATLEKDLIKHPKKLRAFLSEQRSCRRVFGI